MLVWRTCYSALRPEWTTPDVASMLDAFETAKMLFRFQSDGKTYGFFVGIQKEGRLPKPSDRVKSAKQWQGGMVPAKELAVFLGLTSKKIEEDYRDEVATKSRVTRGKGADKSPTGNGGNGSGTGTGTGTGSGEGNGVGKGNGVGIGVGTEAASLPILTGITLRLRPILSLRTTLNTQHHHATLFPLRMMSSMSWTKTITLPLRNPAQTRLRVSPSKAWLPSSVSSSVTTPMQRSPQGVAGRLGERLQEDCHIFFNSRRHRHHHHLSD